MRELARQARDRIESRVLAQLEQTLASDRFPFGEPRRTPEPPRRMTKEIERLGELREAGALTEEQYRKAVDRLLDGDGG